MRKKGYVVHSRKTVNYELRCNVRGRQTSPQVGQSIINEGYICWTVYICINWESKFESLFFYLTLNGKKNYDKFMTCVNFMYINQVIICSHKYQSSSPGGRSKRDLGRSRGRTACCDSFIRVLLYSNIFLKSFLQWRFSANQ